MRRYLRILLALILIPLPLQAKVVVFWQSGFPAVDSEQIHKDSLDQSLIGMETLYKDESAINAPDALTNVDLLILPYGSSVPVEAWKSISHYLDAGGNLLVIGGQPLRVPVSQVNGSYLAGQPQDTYSHAIGWSHTYEVPVTNDAKFQWRYGYEWLPKIEVKARKYFAVEGRLNGLGYMADHSGQLVAAPEIFSDHLVGAPHGLGGRIVALDFDAEAGYWQSADGIALIKQAAAYAQQGATDLSVEMLYSVIRSDESPLITAHLRIPHEEKSSSAVQGLIEVTLKSDNRVVSTATLPVTQDGIADLDVPFHQTFPEGLYTVSAVYREGGVAREFYQSGFLVADHSTLNTGPAFGVRDDFLTRGGKTFFPVGTNYFTTESNNWDFSSARNVWNWEQDFADMEAHGVSFVRTGVWMPNGKFIENDSGKANERFLRNLEAYLDCAHRHHIVVNFTFFAFSPHSGSMSRNADPNVTPANPYLDPAAIAAEQEYVRSVVERFKDVPWLSWDLINEPSFSNPRQIFHGNYPNGDPAEVSAWHKWLSQRYGNVNAVSSAWRVPVTDVNSFDNIPLPTADDLHYGRYGSRDHIRAVDYNLFAQDMFSNWVKSMVSLIRSNGSNQLINVGQDEGGITDRVLNQFYGGAGVSFTTNHTYWQDDALLWDSVAARRVGMPNITGETGYQPAWSADGSWRYDEFTGLGLTERKWVLGFASGSSGAVQWDWAREVDFGMQRSDGSAKVWENMMKEVGQFVQQAAPYADALIEPDVAIILPQSFQLSSNNSLALEAQQTAVRALYQVARSQAYVVGEYQTQLLGNPKLMILPSAYGLDEDSWKAIQHQVEAGAVLLVTGPFDGDAHLHATGRQDALGLSYQTVPLTIRENQFHYPGGEETLEYAGSKTTVLDRAIQADGTDWTEKSLGKGRILFSALPLELNGNLKAVGDVYAYALKVAGIKPVYTTTVTDPGILICPTVYPKATLYVLTSESNQEDVSFVDVRSGKASLGNFRADVLPCY